MLKAEQREQLSKLVAKAVAKPAPAAASGGSAASSSTTPNGCKKAAQRKESMQTNRANVLKFFGM